MHERHQLDDRRVARGRIALAVIRAQKRVDVSLRHHRRHRLVWLLDRRDILAKTQTPRRSSPQTTSSADASSLRSPATVRQVEDERADVERELVLGAGELDRGRRVAPLPAEQLVESRLEPFDHVDRHLEPGGDPREHEPRDDAFRLATRRHVLPVRPADHEHDVVGGHLRRQGRRGERVGMAGERDLPAGNRARPDHAGLRNAASTLSVDRERALQEREPKQTAEGRPQADDREPSAPATQLAPGTKQGLEADGAQRLRLAEVDDEVLRAEIPCRPQSIGEQAFGSAIRDQDRASRRSGDGMARFGHDTVVPSGSPAKTRSAARCGRFRPSLSVPCKRASSSARKRLHVARTRRAGRGRRRRARTMPRRHRSERRPRPREEPPLARPRRSSTRTRARPARRRGSP